LREIVKVIQITGHDLEKITSDKKILPPLLRPLQVLWSGYTPHYIDKAVYDRSNLSKIILLGYIKLSIY
jgi:hypothetical protein